MRPHSGVRVSALVLTALATATLAWLALRWVTSGGAAVPPLGWIGLVVMVFLGGALLVAGWQVRKVRDGQRVASVTPLRAARTLVLAQAGAFTGSVLVGWYVANILVLLPDADVDSQRARIWPFLIHAVVAALLAGAGMLVQRWCRVRPRDDEGDEHEPPTNGTARR
ncbi:hypothetical protein N865_09015 [Intrasporangium oryzae NRRL B-24470]|uniref:DUF3180 domain-containing protein n=1 Tax=Intrasporangium oryzae NRRL B-24470 TaxID=1386089 RepID=W9GC07_9MICO|nr:DUF3180 domain-containing protein [Intrasporangium oryzae]EWT03580.1 hypothetical protein N865_09015 [Intrasporangium oryzae NRRL B-24470]